jgi:hypothetical protein
MAEGKSGNFAKSCSSLGKGDRVAKRRVRGNIAHRVSTTVRNLIAFFG